MTARQAAHFYSPTAQHWTARDVDLALVRSLHERGCLRECRFAWLGELCHRSHQLLVRFGEGPWYFAMGHMPGSCVLAVPAITGTLPGTDQQLWAPMPGITKPTLLAVTRLDGWRAIKYVWRSPTWQAGVCPAAPGMMPPALRAFQAAANSPQDTLLKVAAREAFFRLDKPWLTDLSSFLGIPLPESASLFDMLLKLATSILAVSEEQAMVPLRPRMGAYAAREQFSEELANLDEAAELLERNGAKRMHEEKDALQKVRCAESEYKRVFAQKATELRGKVKKERRQSGGGSSKRMRIPSFPPHSISIEQARQCLLAGGKLWIGKGEGNWQGHYVPFPRVSRSWARYGELPALMMVLQYLWDKHCEATGCSREDCMVDGLWEGVGSSSSSSSARPSGRAASSRAGGL